MNRPATRYRTPAGLIVRITHDYWRRPGDWRQYVRVRATMPGHVEHGHAFTLRRDELQRIF